MSGSNANAAFPPRWSVDEATESFCIRDAVIPLR